MNAAGMVADMLKSAGTDIVMQSPSEWHTALEKNLIDGLRWRLAAFPCMIYRT